MKNSDIVKTVIGPTDKQRFEDIAVLAIGERGLLHECQCGEELTNIIATQPEKDVKPGADRMRALKCHECGAIWIDKYKEVY